MHPLLFAFLTSGPGWTMLADIATRPLTAHDTFAEPGNMTEPMQPEAPGSDSLWQQPESVDQLSKGNSAGEIANAPRQPGSAAGKIDIKAHFDEPLPEWLLDAFGE
jgi:hypothetical protein